ncbi:MAG: substrate-binding domain-containing protein [Verrucomicrobia bacterium]|nr:substrate-binding domain-containing protein [Verrucomicrobiota bacterium]
MRPVAILLGALAIGIAAIVWFQRGGGPSRPESALTVYCATGIKKPVEAAAADYRREFGVEVNLQFGGSGTMLSAIRVAKQGDLYIAADDGAVADARKFDAVRETIAIARQHPVIAVRAGNPKAVRALADLLRGDVRVELANPEAASIGRASRAARGETWAKLAARAAVMKPTVTEIANDLSIGAVDAAIVWDGTVPQFKGIEAVEAPELSGRIENVSVAVLVACRQPAAALRFARYLAAPEKGGAVFKNQGFTPAAGDHWALKPEMILYSGGLNRLAIEKLLKEFADHEGVTVTTVFNGCGILCAAMKTMGDSTNPKFPDAYYACDLCFVPPVAKHFPEATVLTETDIVIATPKGNRHGIRTMADLAKPGLRIGLCNAEQSTLGYMTRGMLRQSALHDAVRKNVVVEVPTADFLINQMRAGALDAAIVYRVNVQPVAEHFDAIDIAHAGAKAAQPFSVRADSANHQLASRLLDFLKVNRGRFEAAGFRWRGDEPATPSDKIFVPPWLRQPGADRPNKGTKG